MNKVSSHNLVYLTPGDVVDIIAPSSKGQPSVAEKLRVLLESWGLQARYPEDLFGESLLYANSDAQRFKHLQTALTNTTSKAVWCLLGGYGATKLIPHLAQIRPPTQAKIFIGLSDITALHIFLQNHWGWSTIHGPSGYQAALNRVSSDSIALLKKLLFKEEAVLNYAPCLPLNDKARQRSTIHAPIIGGNLHLIQASLGTAWQINSDNKILFIEDINERAYRIDRILTHLEQAGIFKNINALLIGDMIDKGEPNGEFLVMKVIQEFAAACNFPVLQIKDIGHGPVNNPLILGSDAQLTTGERCTLEFRLD